MSQAGFEFKVKKSGPVECLGITFESDAARRDYFIELLRNILSDENFRKIEGFPVGSDDDILSLSDPPYYTACPNPWISNFISEWGKQKPISSGHNNREPFATDVSEGKNDPIYNAHSYHTKVPHKAIVRYILHYTDPGDVIFDGFCGTGMAGVGAQMCGDRSLLAELGYRVDQDGSIYRCETDENNRKTWTKCSNLGKRKAVLNDLSPFAGFIAYNYNKLNSFESKHGEIVRLYNEFKSKYCDCYKTLDPDTGVSFPVK